MVYKDKEYQKKYRESHKEEIKEYSQNNRKRINEGKREYYKKNKEKILKQNKASDKRYEEERKKHRKEYFQENKEKINKVRREWYNGNKEKMNKRLREYRKENKEKVKGWWDKASKKIFERENQRRKQIGLKLIGEGFKKEMELLVYIHRLFLGYDVLSHYRKPLIDWGRVGLELDIYIPQLRLAFEYMGKQHYEWRNFFHKTKEEFEAQKYRDRCKKRLCKLKGIKLIRIKYDEKLSEQLILSKLNHFPLIGVQEKLVGIR